MKRNESGKILWLLLAGLLTWSGRESARAQEDSTKALPSTGENVVVETTADEPSEKRDRPGRARRTIQEPFTLGGNFTLKEGETSRDAVVLFGSAKIDGEVDGDLVVIFGKTGLNGKVNGNLVSIFGPATLGPLAEVEENAVVVGGPLKEDPASKIHGKLIPVLLGENLPELKWLTDWLVKGLLLGRPLPPQVTWVWMAALGCLMAYCLIAVIFPRSIDACFQSLETRPVSSFFVGLLWFILFGPLNLLLVASGVGLLVIPFLFCAMIAAFVFGKIAVYRYTGHQLAGQFGLAGLQLPLVALLIGASIFYLLYTIPFLGFLAWGVTAPLGIGAVLMAVFGSFRAESIKVNPGVMVNANIASGPNLTVDPEPAVPPVYPTDAGGPAGTRMIELRRAGFWSRLVATVIDLFLIGLPSAFIGSFPLFILAWIGYHLAMWTWKGTTLGGIVMRTKIVRTDGGPIDFAVAMVRCLASFFSAAPFFLGFFWAGWDRQKQSWHDKIAGTVLVKMPTGTLLI